MNRNTYADFGLQGGDGNDKGRIQPGEPILVSACLLGIFCRYDGCQHAEEKILQLCGHYHAIPVCPEQLGGLSTPRDAVELCSGRAVTREGVDVTEAFTRGAEQVVRIARLSGARLAILQPRSPSCGVGRIYDGTFSGTLKDGHGMLVRTLLEEGCLVVSAENGEALERLLFGK